MAKKPKLTPVTVPIRLKSGRMTTGTRYLNLVPAPSSLTPPAGPAHNSLTSSLVSKIATTEEHPEFDPVTGLNAAGWTRDGHRSNGLIFDNNGLDRDGYPEHGKPVDYRGFTPRGFDLEDFDRGGIHRDTGTPFDTFGCDRHGFGADGKPFLAGYAGYPMVDRPHNGYGFLPDGTHRTTGTRFNKRGFDWNRIHQTTGTRFNPRGFDRNGQTLDGTGRDVDGRDYRGFDSSGRNAAGNHFTTGTPIDARGFDATGSNTRTGTALDSDGWDVNNRRKNGRTQVRGRNFEGVRVP